MCRTHKCVALGISPYVAAPRSSCSERVWARTSTVTLRSAGSIMWRRWSLVARFNQPRPESRSLWRMSKGPRIRNTAAHCAVSWPHIVERGHDCEVARRLTTGTPAGSHMNEESGFFLRTGEIPPRATVPRSEAQPVQRFAPDTEDEGIVRGDWGRAGPVLPSRGGFHRLGTLD